MIDDISILNIESPHSALFDLTDRFGSGAPLKRIFQIVLRQGCQNVLIEENFEDNEWTSEHRMFYSKLFKTYSDKTTRLHFFKCRLKRKDVFELNQFQEFYLGYCVLRPLQSRKVVDAVIGPIEDANEPKKAFVLCQTIFPIKIAISPDNCQSLEISGFPFIQQDALAGCCAHVALAMTDRFLIRRNNVETGRDDKSRFVGDIANLVSLVPTEGRKIPTPGLRPIEISEALKNMEYSPLVYEYRKGVKSHVPPEQVIYHYLESQIPVLVGIVTENGGHVLTVVGHSFDPELWWALAKEPYYNRKPSGGDYHCSTTWIPNFIVHDDNFGPYLTVPKEFLWGTSDDKSLIVVVPLQNRIAIDSENELYINMDGERAERLADSLIASAQEIGQSIELDAPIRRWFDILNEHHQRKDIVLRTCLVKSDDFIDRYIHDNLRVHYRQLSLPPKFWLTEISIPELFCQERLRLGEVIIDPTSTAGLGPAPFLALHLPGFMITRNVETEETNIIPLPGDGPYQHVIR